MEQFKNPWQVLRLTEKILDDLGAHPLDAEKAMKVSKKHWTEGIISINVRMRYEEENPDFPFIVSIHVVDESLESFVKLIELSHEDLFVKINRTYCTETYDRVAIKICDFAEVFALMPKKQKGM